MKIEFSLDEINKVLMLMSEMPYKYSVEAINFITQIANKQIEAQKEVK
jgi:hypothetical protein